MSDFFLPSDDWFSVASEILKCARNRMFIKDFKLNSQMKPYEMGGSYTFTMDVFTELSRTGVIKIQDEKLLIGNSNNVNWLERALRNGYANAWKFVEVIESEEGIKIEERVFNKEVLTEIGNLGESFVLESLKKLLPREVHTEIIHVAQQDDTAGFDIYTPSVKNVENLFRIEVKTSTRYSLRELNFFLSRKEFNVGRKNRNWCIVFVSISEGNTSILGHLYCHQIESRMPKDIDERAKWQSSKVTVERSMLRTGLP